MNIYTYWTGPKPPWIELCLESLEKNTPGIKILDKRSWQELFKGGPIGMKKILRQIPNVQSDYIRAYLLYHYGGVWVDADCVCFKDLHGILDYLQEKDFVAYHVRGTRLGQMCTALLASEPHSELARHYLTIMENRLRGRKRILGRLALGPRVLMRACRVSGQRPFMVPQHLVHPFANWLEYKKLWQGASVKIDNDAFCFMLTRKALGPWSDFPREKLMEMNNVVGEAFRKALNA